MNDLINCGVRRIQKIGRVSIGKDAMESNGLKEGDVIEVFLKKKASKQHHPH